MAGKQISYVYFWWTSGICHLLIEICASLVIDTAHILFARHTVTARIFDTSSSVHHWSWWVAVSLPASDWVQHKRTMVCCPCFLIPLLLWVFHRFLAPLIMPYLPEKTQRWFRIRMKGHGIEKDDENREKTDASCCDGSDSKEKVCKFSKQI